MSLLRETKRLLHSYGIYPKKRLGQNFMIDEGSLQRMISHASVNVSDVVLEVGAGLGYLTSLLARKCRRVIAIEVDPRLVRVLRIQLRNFKNIEIIEGDVLNEPISSFNKVVSTPPYSISSPLLFWLFERKFDCAVLTFQKEFAERLNAPVGSKDYSRLTVAAYFKAEVEILDTVPREMFYPLPDVDSLVVHLKPRKTPPFTVKDKKVFYELVQTLFTQRNKKLRNAVLPFLSKCGISRENATKIADSLMFHDKRVRELAPEDFGALANELA